MVNCQGFVKSTTSANFAFFIAIYLPHTPIYEVTLIIFSVIRTTFPPPCTIESIV